MPRCIGAGNINTFPIVSGDDIGIIEILAASTFYQVNHLSRMRMNRCIMGDFFKEGIIRMIKDHGAIPLGNPGIRILYFGIKWITLTSRLT